MLSKNYQKIQQDIANDPKRPIYPTKVMKVPYGYGLFCAQDIEKGTVLEKFQGPGKDDKPPFMMRCRI